MSRPLGYPARVWESVVSTAELPNVSGAVVQSYQLTIGDLCVAASELYVCTTSTEGAAAWAKVASAGETITTLITSGDVTVGGALGVTGATTFTGGVVGSLMQAARNVAPAAATTGTDGVPANGTQFVTGIRVENNMTLTNINYLIGSVGGTDKVYGVVYNSAGAVVIASSVSGGGATVGTAANIQTLAVTTPTALTRGLYYVGISMNGNTARLRLVPAHCQAGIWAGSVSQTHGTVAAITPPTTFTADKAPYVFLD
jgi:hypothetical protein